MSKTQTAKNWQGYVIGNSKHVIKDKNGMPVFGVHETFQQAVEKLNEAKSTVNEDLYIYYICHVLYACANCVVTVRSEAVNSKLEYSVHLS